MAKEKEKTEIALSMPSIGIDDLTNSKNAALVGELFNQMLQADATDITADYVKFDELEKTYTQNGVDVSDGIPVIFTGVRKIKAMEGGKGDANGMVDAIEFVYQKFGEDGKPVASKGICASAVLVANLSTHKPGSPFRIKQEGKGGQKPNQYDLFKISAIKTA